MRSLLTILLFLPFFTKANSYYVSNTGTGSGNGLSASTPWTPNQFRSSSAWGAGDNIYFHAGETFTGRFNFTRSGAVGNPVYVGRYGTGANPIFSGYTTLTNWTSYGSNIYAAPIAGATQYLHNVIVGGQFMHTARYPNTGFLTITPISTTQFTDATQTGTPSRIGDSVCVKDSRYTLTHALITNQSGGTITVNGLFYSGVGGNGYFYFGLKYLDTAWEYSMNATGDSLLAYFSTNPSGLTVQASTVDTLIYVTGSYIHFDSLQVQGGNMYNILNPFGSGNLTWMNSWVDHGYTGFDIRAQRDSIISCTIRDMLNNGIMGPTNNITKYSSIKFCKLRSIGLIPGMGKSGTGNYEGVALPADGLYAYKLDIDSIGYHGIYSSFDSICIDTCLVNHTGATLSDGGGIYIYDHDSTAYPHTRQVRGNLVMNGIGNTEGIIVDPGTRQNGIYTDARANLVNITDNTCIGNSGPGYYNHGSNITYLRDRSYDNGLAQFYHGQFSGQPITGITMKYCQAGCPDTSKSILFLYSPNTVVTGFFQSCDSNYYATTNAVKPFKYQQNGGSINTLTLSGWQSFIGSEGNSYQRNGSISVVYNPTFSKYLNYFRGRYINPAGIQFDQLASLGPQSSEILILRDNGYIIIPSATRIKGKP